METFANESTHVQLIQFLLKQVLPEDIESKLDQWLADGDDAPWKEKQEKWTHEDMVEATDFVLALCQGSIQQYNSIIMEAMDLYADYYELGEVPYGFDRWKQRFYDPIRKGTVWH